MWFISKALPLSGHFDVCEMIGGFSYVAFEIVSIYTCYTLILFISSGFFFLERFLTISVFASKINFKNKASSCYVLFIDSTFTSNLGFSKDFTYQICSLAMFS